MRTRVLILRCKVHSRRIGVLREVDGVLDGADVEVIGPDGTRSFLFPCNTHGLLIAFESDVRKALNSGQRALTLELLAHTFRALRPSPPETPPPRALS